MRDEGFDLGRSLLDGIDKERGAGWRFVEHTVSIAGFFVELEVALRARTDMRLLGRSEIFRRRDDSPRFYSEKRYHRGPQMYERHSYRWRDRDWD